MEVLEAPLLSDAAAAQRAAAEASADAICVARRRMPAGFATCQHLQDAFGLALTVLEQSSDNGVQNAAAAMSLSEVRTPLISLIRF